MIHWKSFISQYFVVLLKILLINPNTSDFVTQRAVIAARKIASADTIIDGVTGEIGSAIINSETDIAIGAYAAVELAAKHSADYEAVGLAISFDAGLQALRGMLNIPVAGFAEASIKAALQMGDRLMIVSFGSQTKTLYEKLALQYLDLSQLAGVHCIEALSQEELIDREKLMQRLEATCRRTSKLYRGDVIVPLAAVFAGITKDISTSIPIVDPIYALIRLLEKSQVDDRTRALLKSPNFPERKQVTGVSEDLKNYYLRFPRSS